MGCEHETVMAAVASERRIPTLSVEQITGVDELINVVATTDDALDTVLLPELRFYIRPPFYEPLLNVSVGAYAAGGDRSV
jgi:hypothetical protein